MRNRGVAAALLLSACTASYPDGLTHYPITESSWREVSCPTRAPECAERYCSQISGIRQCAEWMVISRTYSTSGGGGEVDWGAGWGTGVRGYYRRDGTYVHGYTRRR